MKIAIIGGGSVGISLGVKLSTLRHKVTIVESNLPRTIKIDDYMMYNIHGDFGEHSHLVKVLPAIEKLGNDYDIVFICTRLFDGVDALRRVRGKIHDNGAIVTIQNIFWIDRASTQINPKNAVFLHMDFACIREKDSVQVVDQGGVSIGIVSRDAYPQMQLVSKVLEDICQVTQISDIVGFSLGRNIMNIAISLLGGVSGLRLGKVLDDKYGKQLFVEIIRESIQLFQALGVNVCPYNDQFDYCLFVRDCHQGKCYRNKMLKILKTNNARVNSSLLLDIQSGNKSEILTVVKTFIKHAEIKHISIPTIVALYNCVTEIISGEKRIDITNLEMIGEKL